MWQGLPSSKTNVPSPLPAEAAFPAFLVLGGVNQGSFWSSRAFPVGCLNSAWSFVLPAPSHPQIAAAPVVCASQLGLVAWVLQARHGAAG